MQLQLAIQLAAWCRSLAGLNTHVIVLAEVFNFYAVRLAISDLIVSALTKAFADSGAPALNCSECQSFDSLLKFLLGVRIKVFKLWAQIEVDSRDTCHELLELLGSDLAVV